ncbi:hypothetical protein SDC9_66614 [bioreactor metagenome]|uniref:Uncharacterized protein n=1 Tax=bioreactor metagenome TaxID=1076179 RepID=A0A644XVI3_9ZZZZ
MSESQNEWNRWFRRIRASHRMTRHDVVACCRLGGADVSASRAEAWSRRAGGDSRRSGAMTRDDFEAFTAGLVDWAREAYKDDAAD